MPISGVTLISAISAALVEFDVFERCQEGYFMPVKNPKRNVD
jgi:hypothetical protein